jgi:Eukaryotic-type DNA primase, large subunit
MAIDPVLAEYPFLPAARDAAEEIGLLPETVATDRPLAVARAVERVERALTAGSVAPERDVDPVGTETELLSYPIARILISLLGFPPAVDKYARAEAATALERLIARTDGADPLTDPVAQRVLTAVGLAGAVEATPAARQGPHHRTYWIALDRYLTHTDPAWDDTWRLASREVTAGRVLIDASELLQLIGAAVETEVASGLPFPLQGTAIDGALAAEVDAIEELLDAHTLPHGVDASVVVPALFPPCMRAAIQQAREGRQLSRPGELAVTSFLVGVGLETAEIAILLDRDPDALESRVARFADEHGTQYPPPTCETMQTYGVCVDPDARCETISHPLSYYDAAVAATDGARDWRESLARG